MESTHWILNILVPPIVLVFLLCFLPPYMIFTIFSYITRSIYSENVAGKVVIITGASSGIGEHLAYEYGRRGSRLALVARRENRLREVAYRAKSEGSPEVITIKADVSRVEDCKRIVDFTVNHFGQLDHLVNNAGVVPLCLFEHSTDVTNFAPAIIFIGITSSTGWLPAPRMSFYNASKAAVINLYESLRAEVGKDIGVTIVTPGLIESEMTQGKFLSKDGQIILDREMRDVQISAMPIRSVIEAAKAIVNSACRGDSYLTEPAWIRTTFYWKAFCPEMLELWNRWLLISGPSERDTISKKILHLSGLKEYLYPESIRKANLKVN